MMVTRAIERDDPASTPRPPRATKHGPPNALRPLAWLTLLLGAACSTGTRPPEATSALAPGAPDWAFEGDLTSDDGATLVCEGTGATKDDALAAARAICNAKICSLCGVQVESVVETTETLSTVDVQRKVVERCQRVRRAPDDVRYEQASCGPAGCATWLQVFFSKEARLAECTSYAQENFADPEACASHLEAFRKVPGLTAAAFGERVRWLSEAMTSCANIDVRPTPRMQALDETLWQGVLAPALIEWQPPRDNPKEPLEARVRAHLDVKREGMRRELAKAAYRPMSRQGLLEMAIFVDRIAAVQSAMAGWQRLMQVYEAGAAAKFTRRRDGAPPDTSELHAAMTALTPIDRFEPRRVHFAMGKLLAKARQNWQPLWSWLLQRYPRGELSTEEVEVITDLAAADGRVSRQEWEATFAPDGKLCVRCIEALLSLAHESDEVHMERWAEAITTVVQKIPERSARGSVGTLLGTQGPERLLQLEAKLPQGVRDVHLDWDRWLGALHRLPPEKSTSAVSPARRDIVARLGKQLDVDIKANPSKICGELDDRLAVLEREGQPTQRYSQQVCRCLESGGSRRVGTHAPLYLRALQWNAQCVHVQKGGTS